MLALFAILPLVLGSAAVAQSAAAETARFRLDLAIIWSPSTHPVDFPADPHVSRLIGATHRSRYVMFADGRTASSGLELVAENGRTSILEAELAEGMRRGRVGGVFSAPGARSPTTLSVEFDIAMEWRLVSFVSMLAPSPDWFTGLSSVDLAPNGVWLDRATAALWTWDAGTDDGGAYAASNADTQPRQSVRLSAAPAFLGEDGLRPLGMATLTRLK